MSDIRKSLESLADSIEKIQDTPAPKTEIKDRELSGNKIHGGRITKFSSLGILDTANDHVLYVQDNGISVQSIESPLINGSTTVAGDLKVNGQVTAEKLHVNEISADVRHERTSPLEFKGDKTYAYGKGLLWSGPSATKQLVIQGNPDRVWSSEDIDLHQEKSYKIGNQVVITKDSLGNDIKHSNLQTLGKIRNLSVQDSFNVDGILAWSTDQESLSIGSEDPKGKITIESLDHQFIIDDNNGDNWKIGTWTTSSLSLITDDQPRIDIDPTGQITIHSKTKFKNKIGIGVNNFQEDVDLTVAGAIRFSNNKHEYLDSVPQSGSYTVGDVVWNSDPKPTGFVGWVCIRNGTPGEWKGFGQIAS
jgi:hypothetical protein